MRITRNFYFMGLIFACAFLFLVNTSTKAPLPQGDVLLVEQGESTQRSTSIISTTETQINTQTQQEAAPFTPTPSSQLPFAHVAVETPQSSSVPFARTPAVPDTQQPAPANPRGKGSYGGYLGAVTITKKYLYNPILPTPPVMPTQVTSIPKKNEALSVANARNEIEELEIQRMERLVYEEYKQFMANESTQLSQRYPITDHNASLPLAKPYVFLHLAKTAGSTMGVVWKRNENKADYLHFWDHPRSYEMEKARNLSTIYGHVRYGVHLYLPRRATYFTMLREPVDRVISHYYYHKGKKTDPNHALAEKHTLGSWLDATQYGRNEMTRRVAGIQNESIPIAEVYEIAKHHLESFGCVGLTERFHESLVLLKLLAGFDNLRYTNTNRGTKKPSLSEIPPDQLQKVRDYNSYDIQLYEVAKQLFQQQIDRFDKDAFKKELDAINAANTRTVYKPVGKY